MARFTGSVMDRIVALCKRRGFIFQSSEIYGGINGFWDYGPLGVELKRNVKEAWWQDVVHNHPPGPEAIGSPEYEIVGLDSAIIMNPKVWEASGHVAGFKDPMVECRDCKARYREDLLVRTGFYEIEQIPPSAAAQQLQSRFRNTPPQAVYIGEAGDDIEQQTKPAKRALGAKKLEWHPVPRSGMPGTEVFCTADGRRYYVFRGLEGRIQNGEPCPRCQGPLTEPRAFNLMFESHAGALRDDASKVYLRPETAQGIFANFKNVVDTMRVRIPFGIAQIGKAFRNEINPRNYTFRSREFEQYEIEFFCHPSEAPQWYEYWRDLRHQWYVGLGLRSDKLRLRSHQPDELAHYARSCADVEYDFPFGVSELEGIANRTDFDLAAHTKQSGKDLSYFDDQRQQRYLPYVIEPSGGVDRSVLAFICEAYTVDESRPSPELMKFHPRLAPIKAAVFPLVNKDGMPAIAEPIYHAVRKRWPAQYDAKASIGKRYARMDEAGTPYCFTIDGQTKEDHTVTVRDRDTGHQERIDKSRCPEYLADKLGP